MDASPRGTGHRRSQRRAAYNARRLAGVDPAALQRDLNERADEPDPESSARRWVPIGPSVVLGGQAIDLPRVTGRIRDIAVGPDGVRAYAAAAMGGVWYTGDGGASWVPVGGWAVHQNLPGGVANGLACGCLLVAFGPAVEQDVVLVGTGEALPKDSDYAYAAGGVGVLSAIGPSVRDAPSPWDPETGLDMLGGTGIFRLVRDPTATPGAAGDRVLACTGKGAFVGVRGEEGYRWEALPALGPAVYDAAWLSDGRVLIVIAVDESVTRLGVAGPDFGDPVEISFPTAQPIGMVNLAHAAGDRYYLRGLADTWVPDRNESEDGDQDGSGTWRVIPRLWRIRDVVHDPYAVEDITYAPPDLWGDTDHFRSLAVDAAADDTVYMGGAGVDDGAQLFRSPVPESTFEAENVGRTVHADIHAIRLVGPPEQRQVWVATDGGIFVSRSRGDAYTYVAVNTGIAALEPEFARTHPTLGQFVAAGMQDNGTDVRIGDTTWKIHAMGDGGGVAFLPHLPDVLVYQYTNAYWGTRTDKFVDPFTHQRGWPDFKDQNFNTADSEYQATNFYSGVAVTPVTADGWPISSRLAIGTNRVWVTDDLPAHPERPNTWQVLPYKGGRAYDPRSVWTSEDLAFDERFGNPGLGAVFALAWSSPSQLIAVFDDGVVRWTEQPPTGSHRWRADTWTRSDGPWHSGVEFTDVCPIPGTDDFYITTTGVAATERDFGELETVWFVSANADRPRPAEFARQHVGPRDPVFAITLDPADPTVVFVGTVVGAWRGVRDADGQHKWTSYRTGLPQAIVQDLHTWTDPDSGTRLLRAALASRGLWEVDLGSDARRETWIRATPFDDRRLPQAPETEPAQATGQYTEPGMLASPDIVVRPAWPVSEPPPFPGDLVSDLGEGDDLGPTVDFNLWTFQTAFRWRYPSVPATGRWSFTLEQFLSSNCIDEQVWNDVLATPTGRNGPLAVYRPPWQTAHAPDFAATEADLAELVVPARPECSTWTAYPMPSTVEILLHHRDSRAVPAGDAWATLLWRPLDVPWDQIDADTAGILAYLTGTGDPPADWRILRQQLTVPLDARLPRAVAIDVDLSGQTPGDDVLFLAYVDSAADDQPRRPPSIESPETLTDLIRSWPSLAARKVQIVSRETTDDLWPGAERWQRLAEGD